MKLDIYELRRKLSYWLMPSEERNKDRMVMNAVVNERGEVLLPHDDAGDGQYLYILEFDEEILPRFVMENLISQEESIKNWLPSFKLTGVKRGQIIKVAG